jgi:hypothetical protein
MTVLHDHFTSAFKVIEQVVGGDHTNRAALGVFEPDVQQALQRLGQHVEDTCESRVNRPSEISLHVANRAAQRLAFPSLTEPELNPNPGDLGTLVSYGPALW